MKWVNVYKEYNIIFSFLSNIVELEAIQMYGVAEEFRNIYDSDIIAALLKNVSILKAAFYL